METEVSLRSEHVRVNIMTTFNISTVNQWNRKIFERSNKKFADLIDIY